MVSIKTFSKLKAVNVTHGILIYITPASVCNYIIQVSF